MLLPYCHHNPLAWCSGARGRNIRDLMIRESSISNVCCPSLDKENDIEGSQVCQAVMKLQGTVRQAIDIPNYTALRG